MKNAVIKPITIILAVFLTIGAFSIAKAAPFGNRVDVVVVKGKSLPAPMLGENRAKYRLFAQQSGNMAVIPFQIDEYDAEGNILVQKGPKARPDADNGAFDANDELVFMAFDVGDKAAAKPTVKGCETFAEISLKDPVKGATGYAYLGKCSAPPAASSTKYVNWNAAKKTAITQNYAMGWQKGNDFYYDYLALFKGPNILDRLKVRVSVGIGALRKKFDENNFKSNLQGVIVGPVRVVDVNLAELKLGPFGSIPNHQYVYFYRDWVYLHNTLDSRFNPAVIGLDFQVGIIHDLNLDRSKGYKICSNSVPNCEVITGKMTPEVDALAKKKLNWGGVEGPEGAVMTRLVMDPGLPTKSMGVYLDDATKNNKPEYVPGAGPEIGFMVIDWKGAPKGVNYLDFYHYFMKKYSQAEVARFDQMIFKPLQVKCTAM